jgi:hypothetical protein
MSWLPYIFWWTRLHGDRQADLGLARQACRAEAIARLDQIVAALPVAGAVFGAGDHTGTDQTGGGLSGCYLCLS